MPGINNAVLATLQAGKRLCQPTSQDRSQGYTDDPYIPCVPSPARIHRIFRRATRTTLTSPTFPLPLAFFAFSPWYTYAWNIKIVHVAGSHSLIVSVLISSVTVRPSLLRSPTDKRAPSYILVCLSWRPLAACKNKHVTNAFVRLTS